MKTIIKYTADTEERTTCVFIHKLYDSDKKQYNTSSEYVVSVSFAGVDVPDSYHDTFDCLATAKDWAKAQL